jgi:hypothetical protein
MLRLGLYLRRLNVADVAVVDVDVDEDLCTFF